MQIIKNNSIHKAAERYRGISTHSYNDYLRKAGYSKDIIRQTKNGCYGNITATDANKIDAAFAKYYGTHTWRNFKIKQ